MVNWSNFFTSVMILTWIASWFATIWLWILVSSEIGFASFITGAFALFLAILFASADRSDKEEE